MDNLPLFQISIMANPANRDNSEMSRKTATIFDCPKWLEEYKKLNYLLYLQTYGESCYQTYIGSTAKTNSKNASFACPICKLSVALSVSSKTVGNIASQLPFIHFIFSLMTDSKSKDKVTYSCYSCELMCIDVKAMHWCQQCNELLCSPCLKRFHDRVKDYGTISAECGSKTSETV